MKGVKCMFDLMITYPFQVLMFAVQKISSLTLASISKHTLNVYTFYLMMEGHGKKYTRCNLTTIFLIKHLEYVTERK